MLYNTYRPYRFDDFVGQAAVVENLRSQSKLNRWFGVYIFCGQYGSGKTSMARTIAMAVNCKHKDEHGNPCCECEDCRAIMEGNSPDVIEIAAAVSTGVDKVRELCNTVSYLPVSLSKKVYIIDEVHALSKAAFQAFLKMLEEPPEHVVFILATTDVAAIPPTVRSRAAVYYFSQLTQTDISNHVKKVSALEHLMVSDDACDVIAKYSQGSMRNALSLLDMAVQGKEGATGAAVEQLLGVSTPDALFSIIKSILCGKAGEVIQKTNELIEGGADINVMVSDMLSFVSDLAVACVAPGSIKGTEHYLSLLRETALLGDASRFASIAEGLLDAKTMLRKQTDTSVLIVSLVKLSRNGNVAVPEVKNQDDENAILRQTVSLLEQKLRILEEALAAGTFVMAAGAVAEKREEPVQTVAEEVAVAAEVPQTDAEPLVVSGTEDESTDVVESEAVVEAADECDAEIVGEPVTVPSVSEEHLPEVQMPETADVTPNTDCLAAEIPEKTPEREVSAGGPSGLFAFLEMDDVESGKVVEKRYHVLERLEREEEAFCAALACCSVDENEEGAVITTTFPAVRNFLESCLNAYRTRGMDITGIKIA